MKVNDIKSNETILKTIVEGECFWCLNKLYIKTDLVDADSIRAVSLTTGACGYFSPTQTVYRADAEVNVKE